MLRHDGRPQSRVPLQRGAAPASIPGVIAFTVYGRPQPAGSKRVVPIGGKKGGRMIVVDAAKQSRPWKNEVAQVAGRVMDGREVLRGALAAEFRFVVLRPKGHYGKRGIRPSAPNYPTVRPDCLKLARAVEDALSGVVYRDDSQIVREVLVKEYGEPERVEVRIYEA